MSCPRSITCRKHLVASVGPYTRPFVPDCNGLVGLYRLLRMPCEFGKTVAWLTLERMGHLCDLTMVSVEILCDEAPSLHSGDLLAGVLTHWNK